MRSLVLKQTGKPLKSQISVRGPKKKVLTQVVRWWLQNQDFSAGSSHEIDRETVRQTFQNLDFSAGAEKKVLTQVFR